MNNILLSGCTGFIGTHLATELARRGKHILGISRQKQPVNACPAIEVVTADVTKPATLQDLARNIDTIIHAAGDAHALDGRPENHYMTTLEGTRNLLADAEKHNVNRFIFISSIKAMPEPGKTCLDENANGVPADAYGLSRLQAEQLVLDYGQQSGMHVSILRPTLVYGPGCKGNLASLLRWIDKGWFPPLPDTCNRRSMVDVRDVVTATLLAADRASANGKICILADGEDYSTHRIVTAMRSALGKPGQTWSLPAWSMRLLGKCGDGYEALLGQPALYNSAMCSRLIDSACYHSVNTETALGFSPGFRLEDALPDMVAAYRSNVPGRTRAE